MKKNIRKATRTSGAKDELQRLCKEAQKELEKAYGLPPRELGKEVDLAEAKVAQLRDCLIERLRKEENSPRASGWRIALSFTNMALSYIVAVEYPATGVHRNHLEQAREALNALPRVL